MRSIPSIEQLRQRPAMRPLEAQYGRAALVVALRQDAAGWRQRVRAGEDLAGDAAEVIERAVPQRLSAMSSGSLRRIINATGVIVHTNLGRAPLARGTPNHVSHPAAARGGRRDEHASRLICRLTDATAAVVVNNNAAAALVTLAALASGREAIVSRGELVEIGGGFRVPDVMAQSGAVLREVGTTNRTRAADYAAAINDLTALILRVHPSTFRI